MVSLRFLSWYNCIRQSLKPALQKRSLFSGDHMKVFAKIPWLFGTALLAAALISCAVYTEFDEEIAAERELPEEPEFTEAASNAVIAQNPEELSGTGRLPDAQIPEREYELWLMPIEKGPHGSINHENVRDITRYTREEDGRFILLADDFPDCQSVVFIIDSEKSEGQDPEIAGLLSLEIDKDTRVIALPPEEEITGDVEFGPVSVSEDPLSYKSTSGQSLYENRDSFTSEAAERLYEDREFHETALASVNVLRNTCMEDPDEHVTLALSFAFGLFFEEEEEGITDAEDLNWITRLNIYSRKTDTEAELYAPDGSRFELSKGLLNDPDVTWTMNTRIEQLADHLAEPGLWELRDEEGSILAEFDLSAAAFVSEEGYPMIPFPSPEYTVSEEDEEHIDRVYFNWSFFDSQGKRVPLADPDQLSRLFDKSTFRMHWAGILEYSYEGYPYLEAQDPGSMQGDIASSYHFDPPFPAVHFDDEDGVTLNYRFGPFECEVVW